MSNGEVESHPFRALLKFLIVAGIVAAVARMLASKRAEYAGLTEAEAKARFEERMGPWIGDEKAAEVAEQVIPKLKESGILDPDAPEKAMASVKEAAGNAADKVIDLADEAGGKAKEMAGKVSDSAKGTANNIGDAVDDAVEKISETTKKTRGS
jgi:uncharacterized protein YjbJ (UPF0337 family)